MKSYYSMMVAFMIVLDSCSAWKETLVAEGNQNDAVRNAVHDFLHTERLSKKDSVFVASIDTISNEILGIGILGYEDKLVPNPKNKIGTSHPYFPTRYLEKENKLFYWYDSTSKISSELISVLSRYNKIDSSYVKGTHKLEVRFNDSKKGVHYYFCRSNLLEYKKVVTTIAMGYYDPPKVRCNPR